MKAFFASFFGALFGTLVAFGLCFSLIFLAIPIVVTQVQQYINRQDQGGASIGTKLKRLEGSFSKVLDEANKAVDSAEQQQYQPQ